MQMKTKGIDVSSYQGVIDWQKAAATGVEFAILKAIRKDLQADRQFEANWEGCVTAGIPVQGVYNYSYATTTDKAVTDAQRIIEILNGRKPMVWMDVEDQVQKNLGSRLAAIINAFGAIITGAGLSFGVYSGLSFYESYIRPYAGQISCPFWIARYPSGEQMRIDQDPADSKRPVIAHTLYGWQYSSKGSIAGISGNVDLNELYVAVDPVNVMPQPQATLHKAGEQIRVSSYYASSMDPSSKAYIRDASGIIMRINAGAPNPYCFGRNGVAIGWCNDGDIRACDGVLEPAGSGTRTHEVKRGDTLSAIAKKYSTTVAAIVDANKTRYPRITANYIVIGWNIVV